MPGCSLTEPGEGQLLGRRNASPEGFTHSRQWAGMRFSFFHERKRDVTVIQKAVADKQPHGRKTIGTRKHRGSREREKQIKNMA